MLPPRNFLSADTLSSSLCYQAGGRPWVLHLCPPFSPDFPPPKWLLELFQTTALGLEESQGEGGFLYIAHKSVCQLPVWTQFSPRSACKSIHVYLCASESTDIGALKSCSKLQLCQPGGYWSSQGMLNSEYFQPEWDSSPGRGNYPSLTPLWFPGPAWTSQHCRSRLKNYQRMKLSLTSPELSGGVGRGNSRVWGIFAPELGSLSLPSSDTSDSIFKSNSFSLCWKANSALVASLFWACGAVTWGSSAWEIDWLELFPNNAGKAGSGNMTLSTNWRFTFPHVVSNRRCCSSLYPLQAGPAGLRQRRSSRAGKAAMAGQLQTPRTPTGDSVPSAHGALAKCW